MTQVIKEIQSRRIALLFKAKVKLYLSNFPIFYSLWTLSLSQLHKLASTMSFFSVYLLFKYKTPLREITKLRGKHVLVFKYTAIFLLQKLGSIHTLTNIV